jgi:hypothetical protein
MLGVVVVRVLIHRLPISQSSVLFVVAVLIHRLPISQSSVLFVVVVAVLSVVLVAVVEGLHSHACRCFVVVVVVVDPIADALVLQHDHWRNRLEVAA